ncbi:MAG TPA: VOC family protein [Acidobacteriaceae bacterium]|jgi:glyoxylase I family protein|nr:VOC family protein [Acidobacteriaceae bacterium]
MAIDVRGVCPLLQVYDMPTSVKFYRDKLGFEVAMTSPVMGPDKFHWALLRLGSTEIMLNTAYEFDEQRPVPADRARVAAHRDTCLYFPCPDVEGAYEELHDKGVAVKPPRIAPYGMKQLSLADPDGYELCFQWKAEE